MSDSVQIRAIVSGEFTHEELSFDTTPESSHVNVVIFRGQGALNVRANIAVRKTSLLMAIQSVASNPDPQPPTINSQQSQ